MQPPTSINNFRRATARRLRANQTDAEISLWLELRKLETKGTHFRRQVPIGRYVADFACLASRLVIELDGSQHGQNPTKARDDARTRWLSAEGYRVLRFWNNDITENLDGVLETIHAALYGSVDAEPVKLKRERRRKDHPTPLASLATLPLHGRGEESAWQGMTDTIFDLFPSQTAGKFGRRQKRQRGSRLPVTIVTGFLGAGKTTLVRRFLDSPEGKGTALIVNEFGSEGIDDALLRESSDEVTLLGNGCLCCNTRTDLQNTLRRLVADRDRGKIPHFGRVLIETSGLADLSPILQTFSTDRALGSEFAIEVVLTVVDAVNGLKNLEKAPEARKQAILADRIVVSKTDISDAKTRKTLTAMLEDLNPRAVIDVAVRGDIDPKTLTDTGQTDAIERHSGFVAEASHSDGIVSFVMRDQTPLIWPVFQRAMETLIALRGPDLLRIKGLLNLAGSKGPVVFQAVQHLIHPPVELSAWPDKDHASRVVFITRGISERQVQDLFAACRALGYSRED